LPHFVLTAIFIWGCTEKPRPSNTQDRKDYIKPIPGRSDSIPQEIKQRGEVLVAYSDCYTCHTIDVRSKGPAFKDIAKRYPVTDGYINLLAYKIIMGGSGAWGYPVMAPHPDISLSDARMMVKFILSLKE
jgi:cytochrome c